MQSTVSIPQIVSELSGIIEKHQPLTGNAAPVSIIITGGYIGWKIHTVPAEEPENEPVLLSERAG